LGYHQILREGFRRLHGKQSSLGVSGDEDVTGAEMIEAQSGDSTDLYRKVLRVKAKKTMVWLENEDSVYRLSMSVISVSPMERIMYQFMKWQENEAYLLECDPPMVVMASSSRSPACIAMREIIAVMLTGLIFPEGALQVSVDDLCNGCLAHAGVGGYCVQSFECYREV